MIRKFIDSESGISIVELMAATLLTVVIGAAGMEFYVSQHQNWINQTEVSDLQHGTRAALDEISSTLRMGGFGVAANTAFDFATDTLIVRFMTGGAVQTVTYYVDRSDSMQTLLMRQSNLDPAVVFAEGVDSLVVDTVSAHLVDLSITTLSTRRDVSLSTENARRHRTLSTRVRLRNVLISG